MPLDPKQALSILEAHGPLSRLFKQYETRPEQQKMLELVVEAFNQNEIALIEAGTGVGKSLAYLIPALLWAGTNQQRVVISTHTINLQEQLLQKDIPIALNALNLSLSAVIVKGMGNYVCKRKVDDMRQQHPLLPDRQGEMFERLEQWADQTEEGTRSSLSFHPTQEVWERVAAEGDTCNKKKCPYYEECFFFRERKKAEEAQILIVNHSLLFADLARRAEIDTAQDVGILPPYSRIIIDEAHQAEDVATRFFADTLSDRLLLKQLNRLSQDKYGRLFQLHTCVKMGVHELSPKRWQQIDQILTLTLPGIATELFYAIQHTFEALKECFPQQIEGEGYIDSKLRLLPHILQSTRWNTSILPQALELIQLIKKYGESVNGVAQLIKEQQSEKLQKLVEQTLHDSVALTNRLLSAAHILEGILEPKSIDGEVKWIEIHNKQTVLIRAPLHLQAMLKTRLFDPFESIILCSATLSTSGSFNFIKERLGLKTPREMILSSPFNYEKKALFLIPPDLPTPSHPDFEQVIVNQLLDIIRGCQGGAFVLFTSYAQLNRSAKLLEKTLQKEKFLLLKQGDLERGQLLKRFRSTKNAVLFGTDSFWEGVDVAGDALRAVIIVKLPFEVPNDPMTEARIELVAKQGKDPFFTYSVPKAVMKFKQGVGRLIRTHQDRGCIICLDSRLIQKNYGKHFLKSLPPYTFSLPKEGELKPMIQSFFRQK